MSCLIPLQILEKVTFISIKQAAGSSMDRSVLNPKLVWPEKKNSKNTLYLSGVWVRLLSDFLCVIVDSDLLFMYLE